MAEDMTPTGTNIRMPKAWIEILRVWGLQNGKRPMAEITREALEMWAKANGVKLPKSTSPRQSQATNDNGVLVSNAG